MKRKMLVIVAVLACSNNAYAWNYWCNNCSEGANEVDSANNVADAAYWGNTFDTNEAYWSLSGISLTMTDLANGSVWYLNVRVDFDGSFDADDIHSILNSWNPDERRLKITVSKSSGRVVSSPGGFYVNKGTRDGVCGRTCDDSRYIE